MTTETEFWSFRRVEAYFFVVAMFYLSACSVTPSTPQGANMPLSPTNVLPFAYFQIDVPQDVDFNQSLVSANAFGNNWRAYPANSQAEFDGIVKAKAQKLYDEKLDEKTIAWNRRNIEDDASVNDERKKPRLLTDLKMTRRLYKV